MSPARRKPSAAARRKAAPKRDFWDGQAAAGAAGESVGPVRAPDDSSAMIRSLGPPPLPGREAIAERYFALAYDKASRRAVALAAASGLIDFGDQEP